MRKKIETALISVFNKEGVEPIVKSLNNLGVKIFSTGGTHSFIEDLGIEVSKVEDLTGYPSILEGRVKTLHPKVFGGILSVRDLPAHKEDIEKYEIPLFDLIIVDLYPFEDAVKTTSDENEIIEKIDIGGISLIRAAAKNYKDVLVVSKSYQYKALYGLLEDQKAYTDLETRKEFAKQAFAVSSGYDAAIFNWFDDNRFSELRISNSSKNRLRYGENPHQKAYFFGELGELIDQISGKEISYNNLLDISAAVNLISEFEDNSLGIIKHNNACGFASNQNLSEAWKGAFEADPISAFGGIIITNGIVNIESANLINKIFFEVIIANDYTDDALELLSEKKNRIIIKQKKALDNKYELKTCLNGVLLQEKDKYGDYEKSLKIATKTEPTPEQLQDLFFANKLVKHTKSNAIVLVKDNKMLSSGMGQTSRVDALKQAIEKAKSFNIDLNGSVLASDAFFPFKDSIEIAAKEGIKAIIQPGGSIRDEESITACNENDIAMVFTGIRHFKH